MMGKDNENPLTRWLRNDKIAVPLIEVSGRPETEFPRQLDERWSNLRDEFDKLLFRYTRREEAFEAWDK